MPLKLAKQFTRGGRRRSTAGSACVSFDTARTARSRCEIEDVASGKRDTVQARKALVLAMPRRSLELLEPTGPVLDRAPRSAS